MKARGQVDLTASNGDVFTLKFGTNAICKLEDTLNKTLGEILEDMKDEGKLSMRTIRTMVRLALVGREATDEVVGDLIDDVGLREITKAFSAVFEGHELATKVEGSVNPPVPIGIVS